MFRGKKLFITVALVTVVIAGSIGGVVLAQSDTTTTKTAQADAMWARVAEIYQEKTGTALDTQALKDAMAQAGSELQVKNMEAKVNAMVAAGKITQEQADQMLEWWQSRPTDLPFKGGMMGPKAFGRGFGMRGGGFGPCFGVPPTAPAPAAPQSTN